MTNSQPIIIKSKKFQKLTKEELIQLANLHVLDENGKDVTDDIILQIELIDPKKFDQMQQLPILIKVDREHTAQVGYLSITLKRDPHYFRYIIMGMIALALGGMFYSIHEHHVNQAQNQQIEQQDLDLKTAENQIKGLKTEIDNLKAAVKQYKQDNNKAELNTQLQNIENQINQLQVNNQNLEDVIAQLTKMINQLIQATPAQLDRLLIKYHLN